MISVWAGWGIGVANELEVDPAGLRVAATDSDLTSADLLGSAQVCAPPSGHPSAAGVAAVNAALTAVQGRQSSRMTRQADTLSVSSVRYDTTDSDGHDAITTVTV